MPARAAGALPGPSSGSGFVGSVPGEVLVRGSMFRIPVPWAICVQVGPVVAVEPADKTVCSIYV